MIPFEDVYGYLPSPYIPYVAGDARVESVNRVLVEREEFIQELKHHLAKAQSKMERAANKHRAEREFEEGEWVYVKLKP